MNPSAHAIRHALGWLLLANLVGLLLSLLLLFPEEGSLFGPLTYGRWYPVHTHAHLYGWCSLPLVALLFQLFPFSGRLEGWARASLTLWSTALAAVCLWFLAGRNTGKLFTEFTTPALAPFVLALSFLWLVLALSWWSSRSSSGSALRFSVVLGLAAVPFGLAWAALPGTFPPVNPRSGGATGHNLLASTLVLLPILACFPLILGVSSLPRKFLTWKNLGLAYLGCWVVWAFLDHGHAPNDDLAQILGLFTLAPWAVLLPLHWAGHVWSPSERSWLRWASLWWAFLALSGCVMFLPGVLDHLKFTNGLVAHTHLAMAGFLSCFLLVLGLRMGSGETQVALSQAWPRRIWNLALAVHVLTLGVLGLSEDAQPKWVFFSSFPGDAAYALRCLSGGLQVAVSAVWFRSASGSTPSP